MHCMVGGCVRGIRQLDVIVGSNVAGWCGVAKVWAWRGTDSHPTAAR